MFGWGGKPARNLPPVNYAEDSDSDEFVSPTRPVVTRAGSPALLSVPQLNDNVDDDLEQVSLTLKNVGHSKLFRKSIKEETEEVIEGYTAGNSVNDEVKADNPIMPNNDAAVVVDFEDEEGEDGEKALDYTRTLKLEWNPQQVTFWFTQLENEMFTCGVKSQWLKRCVLVKNLPPKIQSDVMSLLVLKKSEVPDLIYKEIKTEILRIYAPEQEDKFKLALSRVLVGLPSQLGQQLITDICDKPTKLSCGCCCKSVRTLWTLQLPSAVRGHIANMKFDKDTYNDVFKAADKVFLSTKSSDMAPSVAAIVKVPGEAASTPEVAAVVQSRGGRGGNRGGRHRGGNRGRGGSNAGSTTTTKADTRKRHKSNPPSSCCDNHYRYSDQAWFCQAPLTCPYVTKVVARPADEKK